MIELGYADEARAFDMGRKEFCFATSFSQQQQLLLLPLPPLSFSYSFYTEHKILGYFIWGGGEEV
jgi:hypothetical protein